MSPANLPDDPPNHTITLGAPTEEERRRMPSALATEVGGWGCVTVICGAAAFMLWKLGGWIGSLIGPTASSVGSWIGVFAAAALFGAVAVPLARHGRRTRAATSTAKQANLVEEIRVKCRRAVVIEGDHSSITPGVCVEIGGGKLLLLLGHWLEDGDVIGVPKGERPRPSDDDDRYVNRHPPPWAFPAASFTLRRLPASGNVISLRIDGPYLEPEGAPVHIEVGDFETLPQAAVLEGDLRDVPRAMRRSSPKIVRQEE